MMFTIVHSRFSFLMIAVTVLTVHSASSSDCSPPHAKIECECTTTTVECFGIQADALQIQDILVNFSFATNIILKIDNLQFDPDFMFENNSIKNLTLGYGLGILSSNIFSGLSSSLVSLNLQNNSIKGIDGVFSSLPILMELFLDSNDVHTLNSSEFADLSKLKYLSLTRNNIHKVSSDVFQNLLSLQTLVLSHNNISLVENINIKSNSLNALKIDNCLIEGLLHEDTFSYMPNLEQLDMSYNKLSEIKHHSLSTLKNLKFLNLSYNIINKLDENAFFEITNLTLLDLRGNQIQIVMLTSFIGLQNLKYLDLSGNKLNAVLCDYTTDFTALETIYLQNNEIKSFSSGAFFYSPNLKVLDVAGNSLECSCPLTDTAHYLIENSTMERKDLESISCIIPSTLSSVRIIDYKSSKCTAPEPCKVLNELPTEDDYDYSDEENSSLSTVDIITTSSTTDAVSSQISTITFLPITEKPLSTVNNITEIETTTFQQSTLLEKNGSSTVVHTDISTTSVTDLSTLTSIPTEAINSSELPSTKTVNSSDIFSTETVNSSDIPSTETVNSSDIPSTKTVNSSEILPTETVNSSEIPYTEASVSTSNATITTTSITQSSSEIPYTEASISTANATTTTTSITQSSSEMTTTTVGERITGLTSKSSCLSLSLSVGNISSDSELTILKNFSYDDNIFCLKWTVGSTLGIKRCVIKYTFIKGTKSENINCPTFENEVKEWSKTENIYKFCINIYSNKRIDSCAAVSEKTTTSSTTHLTTPIIMVSEKLTKTELFNQTTTYSTVAYTESLISTATDNPSTSFESSFTLTDNISSTKPETSTITVSSESTEDTTYYSSYLNTTTTSVTKPSVFFILALDVYFNASNLGFITWAVNMEEPLHVCNLTLTATTHSLDHNEGIFPCKNNTHRLRNVKEHDTFKICIVSQHKVSGTVMECSYSSLSKLGTAKESKSKEESLNGSMIPLICLLILLGIIVMFIIYKNIFKKKNDSNKYDVRAEEEKYEQRVKIRPSSNHDQSVRFSYMAKENQELL